MHLNMAGARSLGRALFASSGTIRTAAHGAGKTTSAVIVVRRLAPFCSAASSQNNYSGKNLHISESYTPTPSTSSLANSSALCNRATYTSAKRTPTRPPAFNFSTITTTATPLPDDTIMPEEYAEAMSIFEKIDFRAKSFGEKDYAAYRKAIGLMKKALKLVAAGGTLNPEHAPVMYVRYCTQGEES